MKLEHTIIFACHRRFVGQWRRNRNVELNLSGDANGWRHKSFIRMETKPSQVCPYEKRKMFQEGCLKQSTKLKRFHHHALLTWTSPPKPRDRRCTPSKEENFCSAKKRSIASGQTKSVFTESRSYKVVCKHREMRNSNNWKDYFSFRCRRRSIGDNKPVHVTGHWVASNDIWLLSW